MKNKKQEPVHGGGKGGFSIWVGGGHCIEGHMWQPHDTPDDVIGYKVINYVSKVCEEHKMSAKDAYIQIKNNLILNGIIKREE